MRFEVLDFYGLTEEQAKDAATVLGGGAQRLHPMRGFPNMVDITIDWEATALVVVVNWGSERIGEILQFVRMHRRGRELRLAGVIGRRIWSFVVMPTRLPRWDDGLDDFVDEDFDPPKYYQCQVLMLPWDQEGADRLLEVAESQRWQDVMTCCRVADIVLRHEIGQELLAAGEGR